MCLTYFKLLTLKTIIKIIIFKVVAILIITNTVDEAILSLEKKYENKKL